MRHTRARSEFLTQNHTHSMSRLGGLSSKNPPRFLLAECGTGVGGGRGAYHHSIFFNKSLDWPECKGSMRPLGEISAVKHCAQIESGKVHAPRTKIWVSPFLYQMSPNTRIDSCTPPHSIAGFRCLSTPHQRFRCTRIQNTYVHVSSRRMKGKTCGLQDPPYINSSHSLGMLSLFIGNVGCFEIMSTFLRIYFAIQPAVQNYHNSFETF